MGVPGFRLSRHAREEITRRAIPEEVVMDVLRNPEQTVELPNRRRVLQSRLTLEGKTYLVRVIVAARDEGQLVVTVYRTSKLAKYWRKE
jgi:hypothetical protein